jgi:hypothetical protein
LLKSNEADCILLISNAGKKLAKLIEKGSEHQKTMIGTFSLDSCPVSCGGVLSQVHRHLLLLLLSVVNYYL